MRQTSLMLLVILAVGVLLRASLAVSQTAKPQPFVTQIQCSQVDCLLLTGTPQTAGMRSGFVRLVSGATVGWHTTGTNEETLVILHGEGKALLEGQRDLALAARLIAYFPPATRHNILNTGKAPLEYVYVVAPAAK